MVMSLKDSINLLGRQVKNLKNKSKLPVTVDNMGLAKPEMLSFFNPIIKPEQTDIFTLEPGFYEISNPKNVPNNIGGAGTWFVRIWQTGGDKTYWIQLVAGNRFFKLNTHENGSQFMPTLWQEVKGEVTLWAGSISTKGTKIDLNDSLDRYSAIEISYSLFGNIENDRIYAISSNQSGNGIIPSDIHIASKPNTTNSAPTYNGLDFLEFELAISSDKRSVSLVSTNSHHIALDTMSTSYNDLGSAFKLMAIIGIR
ncbi:hypothetical protein ITR00_05590 [Pediococcus pentosaceus]|uniref:hypothetical protein n=1 Tax=Pediococcus pentosaceus TaxID=1255 RepID=UPI00190D9447|nr:hypothetical protein [Pediococcus pentosaceus]MBF7125534.1 hypothetical protein [Pediococcus pentosaceus]WPK17409.1 hypothetical protein R6U75_04520 [Pediococcus pentosaceus]